MYHQNDFIMYRQRFLTIVVFLCLLVVSAAGQTQEVKLTMSFKNESLHSVFMRLEKATSYKLLFSYDDIKTYTVNGKIKDASFEEMLGYVLKDKPLTYKINGRLVSVIALKRGGNQHGKHEMERFGGHVYYESDRSPVVGAQVKVVGTDIIAVTDLEGAFTFNYLIDTQSRVQISYIGMKTVTVPAKADMRVYMKEDNLTINEVVITGYQTIDKRKLTSAVTSVSAEDVFRPDVTSIDKMLEGKIPDLMFSSNSGEVGTTPRLRIRGTSTLIGNREPLWVLDGIVLQDPVNVSTEELNNPDYINRIGNAIAGINPQDIERIDVLKDASATALYGAKAANGVIVITTKKGHVGRPIVRYNGMVTYKRRPRYTDSNIDLMNSQERIDFSRDLFNSGYRFSESTNLIGYEGLLKQYYQGAIDRETFTTQTRMLEATNTDWFKILTQDALSTQHTVSLSGGSDRMRYYTSLGYTNEEDVIKGSDNKRYTLSMKLDATLNKIFSVQMNLLGSVSDKNYISDDISPLNYAYETSRAIPAYNSDGSLYYYQKGATPTTSYDYNVLNEIANSSNSQKGTNINASLTLNARFTDYLKASIIGSIQTSTTDQEQWWGEQSWYVASLRQSNYGEAPVSGDDSTSTLPFGGELTTNHVRSNAYMLRTQLDFNKYLGQTNHHNISASVGFELNSTKYDGYYSVNRGYYKDRGKQFSSISLTDYPAYATWLESNYPTITDNLTNLISGYATVSYSYRNFFTLNANARIDGSNKFGDRSNEKLLPIWSVSGNYNLSEHSFLKKDWIDMIMLKMSYGYQGNMLEGQSPQMIITQKPMDTLYNELVSELAVYPNPNLRWEKTNSFNAGLEMSFFNRRLQLEGNVYYKKTSDAFLTKDISSVNGVEEYVVNSGEITNYGYSIAVTAVPVRLKDFSWVFATSFSKVFNKLNTQPGQEQYELDDFLNGTALINGEPVGTFYSYKFVGLSPNDGSPIFDTMEDRQDELASLTKYEFYTSILGKSGSREPTMSGSLNNTLTYKNWRLNLLFNYSLGSKIRLLKLYNSFDPVYNVNREFVNHWTQPGDEAYTNIPFPTTTSTPWSTGTGDIPAIGTSTWTMYNYGSQRVVSGDYLKLATMSLTYEFPVALISKLNLSRLALSLTGNNLYTLCSSKLKGQTPQQSGFAEVQLTDRPSFTLGIDISF